MVNFRAGLEFPAPMADFTATLPVPAALKRWMLFLLISAVTAGCASSEFGGEHPVDNQVPMLKPGVYTFATVDTRPVATREVEPDYPPQLGSILTGKAVVVFTVRADGKVADASVVEADDTLFGESAVGAVLKWRFRPARVRGAPVDCRMTLPFFFTLPDGRLPDDGWTPDGSSPPPNDSQQRSVEAH
jgi:TonB family protein